VEYRRRQEQALIVREAIRRGVDVSFDRRDDTVAVRVDASHFRRVCAEEPLLKVLDVRRKRRAPHVDVEVYLMGEPARDVAKAELALRVDVAVELVRITWQARIVSEHRGQIDDAGGSGAGHDRLQGADLPVLESVRGQSEVVRKASGEGQLVQRVH